MTHRCCECGSDNCVCRASSRPPLVVDKAKDDLIAKHANMVHKFGTEIKVYFEDYELDWLTEALQDQIRRQPGSEEDAFKRGILLAKLYMMRQY